MKSAKRKILKKYLHQRCKFIGTIQSINDTLDHMILIDVYMMDGESLKRVANHIHVFGDSYELQQIKDVYKYDCIWFSAIPQRYKKIDNDGNEIYNYSLASIDNIRLMEVEYDE